MNRPLTSAQAERFRSAVGLLQAGKADQALAIATALAREAPAAADAQQLLAMSLADLGKATEAEAAFRCALQLSPGSAAVAVNFATWLRKADRLADAAKVLAAAPESAQVRIQQGLLALQMRDFVQAREAFERATRLQPDAVAAWHGLGNALHGMDEPALAAAAFHKAVLLAPQRASAWINLGTALRLTGHLEESLVSLRRAENLGGRGPELADTINGVLAELGRPDEALAGARELVASHPGSARAHDTLAHLLWEYGAELAPAEDPLQALRTAADAQSGHRELQLKLARMLARSGDAEEALSRLQEMRRDDGTDPILDWFVADTLDTLGRHAEAGDLYAGARRLLGDSSEFLNAHARHSFRAGRHDEARACAEQAVKLAPHDQEAWAHLGTAWRLAGDPREDWLFDYERLVGYVEVAPPPDYADLPAFLAALRDTLEAMHLSRREPIDQSVRNGSQTPGRLFGRDNPVLRAAENALREAVEGWLATLPDDPVHPFLSRKRRGVRFTGSWSVRLNSSGRHSNHIHNEGWMSSAFYVALPASMHGADAGSRDGWIQFGQPLEELGLDLPPRRLIQPRPGHLALFPSFMWHGTVPFIDPEPRLTVAFDMKPA